MNSVAIYSPIMSAIRTVFEGSGSTPPLYDFRQGLPAALSSFTRTGLGTLIDADGNVAYGAHNLFVQNRDASTAQWQRYDITVTGAPGEQTATVAVSGGSRYFGQTLGIASGIAVRVRIKLSAGASSKASAGLFSSGFVPVAAVIVSGPGSVSAGPLVTVDGLTSDITIVELSATLGVTNPALLIYPNGAGNAVGNSVKIHGIYSQAGTAALVEVDNGTTSPIYLPRITHDPVTHASLGLLVEAQETDLVGRTEDFPAWLNNGLTFEANTVTAPDGSSTADYFVETATTDTHQCYRTFSVTGNNTYWATVWAKTNDNIPSLYVGSEQAAGTAFNNWATVRLSDGVVLASSGSPQVVYQQFPNNWARIAVQVTIPSGTTSAYLVCRLRQDLVYLGNPSNKLAVWGANFTRTLSSYIPNPGTGTAVRAADGNWDITGAAFTALWGAGSERTIIVEWWDTGARADVLSFFGTAGANLYQFNRDTFDVNFVNVAAVTYIGPRIAGTLAAPARNKLALSVGTSNGFVSLNGGAPVSVGIPAGPITTARIAGAATHLNPTQNILASLDSRPTALTGAALQALSAL